MRWLSLLLAVFLFSGCSMIPPFGKRSGYDLSGTWVLRQVADCHSEHLSLAELRRMEVHHSRYYGHVTLRQEGQILHFYDAASEAQDSASLTGNQVRFNYRADIGGGYEAAVEMNVTVRSNDVISVSETGAYFVDGDALEIKCTYSLVRG